jgi:hypothetical protein
MLGQFAGDFFVVDKTLILITDCVLPAAGETRASTCWLRSAIVQAGVGEFCFWSFAHINQAGNLS